MIHSLGDALAWLDAQDLPGEIWIVSPTIPTRQVSNMGRIRLIPFEGLMPYGGSRFYMYKPTFGCWNKTDERYTTGINGKTYRLARLICEAFHGLPPFKRAVVMHLDENAANNRSDNLCWGTQKENLNAVGFIAYCRNRLSENSPTIKGRKKKEAEMST